MLESIFSSKMFLASKNKSKITTALNDPLNGELVQQLRSYLDDDFLDDAVEYRKTHEVPEDDTASEPANEPSETQDTQDTSERPEAPRHSGGPSSRPSMTDTMNDLSDNGVPDANDPMFEETTETSETSSNDSSSDTDDVEESKKILPDLVSILNSSDKTKGVRRITSSQDSELWIYYNDDVNLNHVMESVISSVTTCCPDVQFSRLARTYNAVVFSR